MSTEPRQEETWACPTCEGTCSVHRRDGTENPCPECDGQGRMHYCADCGVNPIPVDLAYCWMCLGSKFKALA